MRYEQIIGTIHPDTIRDINNISEEINNELEKEEVDKRKVSELIYRQFIKGLNMNTNNRHYGMLPY